MSRASIRMKQYRPVSADFSKVGSGLSAVFGLNQESNDDKTSNGSNGVLLINCKYNFYKSYIKSLGLILRCNLP